MPLGVPDRGSGVAGHKFQGRKGGVALLLDVLQVADVRGARGRAQLLFAVK